MILAMTSLSPGISNPNPWMTVRAVVTVPVTPSQVVEVRVVTPKDMEEERMAEEINTAVRPRPMMLQAVVLNGAGVELELSLTMMIAMLRMANNKAVTQVVVTPNPETTVTGVAATGARTKDIKAKAKVNNKEGPAVVAESCTKPKRCCTTSKTLERADEEVAVATTVSLGMKGIIRLRGFMVSNVKKYPLFCKIIC